MIDWRKTVFDKGITVSLVSYVVLTDLVAKSMLSSGSFSYSIKANAAKDFEVAIRAVSCAWLRW